MISKKALGIFVFVFLIGIFFVFGWPSGNGVLKGVDAVVYKSLNCGCCEGQISLMESENMNVEVKTVKNIETIKDEQNIPASMRSCHTSFIDGYFVEGHVPTEAIVKLLEERPDIDGISLPGMPAGAPGMGGVKQGKFIIYSIKDGKVVGEFARI